MTSFATSGLFMSLAVLVALAVDRWLGEPKSAWHPVVWMGRFLGALGSWVAPRSGDSTVANAVYFVRGAAAWLAGAALFASLAWCIQRLVGQLGNPWLEALTLGFALKPLLAWAMLKSEVLAVEAALQSSLNAGRKRLAWLVSRDVTKLTECEVREAAIESLAENLNDSVVAPIFWFILFGLPGAALYRFANTADAMWGYRGERNGQVWEWGGKWAARADDALSWMPARIAAALLMLAGGMRGLQNLPREAERTPSPNSGWPMAAMALTLNRRLGKAGAYQLHASAGPVKASDTQQSIILATKALLVAVFIGFIAIFFEWLAA